MSEGARRRPHAGGPEKAMRLLLYVTTHMTHMHLECWLELLALAETSKTSSPTRGRRGGIGWSKASSSISKTRGRTSGGTKTRGREMQSRRRAPAKVVSGVEFTSPFRDTPCYPFTRVYNGLVLMPMPA